MDISDKRLRTLWDTYRSLEQQLRELIGDPLSSQPGDDDAWDILDLSCRPFNAIANMLHHQQIDVFTVGDVAKLRDSDLLRIKNFGRGSLRHVREAIRVHRLMASRREHEQDEGR